MRACTDTEYRCPGGTCISTKYLCDGIQHCVISDSDKSASGSQTVQMYDEDENVCGKFEHLFFQNPYIAEVLKR